MSKIAFLFPGQGSQYVGMGRQLIEDVPAARELFIRAGTVLGYDLAKVCIEGPEAELNSTAFSQPALFVTSLAALESLRSQSPAVVGNCEFAAGLSLGEYSALVFAGGMKFEDALAIVQARGQSMQIASDAALSGMVSVLGLELEQVEAICGDARNNGETLQVANLLCPSNVVISGHRTACDRAQELAEERGAMKAIKLSVAGAFHTPLMDSAVDKLRFVLENVPMSPPRIPVVSNVDAQPHNDTEEIRRLLIEQVVSPVCWEDSMRYLLGQGCDAFYEVGPGRVLRGLLRRIERKVSCQNVMG